MNDYAKVRKKIDTDEPDIAFKVFLQERLVEDMVDRMAEHIKVEVTVRRKMSSKEFADRTGLLESVADDLLNDRREWDFALCLRAADALLLWFDVQLRNKDEV